MANYTFTFKKDDIFVEFTTTDKDMIIEQFDLWVTDATEYAKTHQSVEKKNLEAVDRQKRYEARRQERIEREAKRKAELEQKQREEDEKAAWLKEKALKEQAQQEKQQAQKASNASEAVVVPTEPVTINSLQKSDAPAVQTQPQPQNTPDFDKVLEQKIANPTFAPNELRDERFVEFFNSKNHETKLQHLVIGAFYLLQYEKIERFSLKQINSKLMHNISEVIDHSVLQDAMNNGIIEIYPDLTGTSEIREYRLTEKGEDFFINGLQ